MHLLSLSCEFRLLPGVFVINNLTFMDNSVEITSFEFFLLISPWILFSIRINTWDKELRTFL